MSMATATRATGEFAPMTAEEKHIIFASSLGTVFEWYDFYLYGSLATIIGAQFFSQFPLAARNIFALLAFAAGRWALISLAVVAVVTNLEIMAMHLVSPVPPVDVRSIFRLRKTKHG